MIALKLNMAPARRALPADKRRQARTPARARRTRGAGIGWVLIAFVLLGVLGLAYVAETATATQASYQIGALKAEQNQLLAEQQQIRYQISLQSSAGRIDADASRLGMVRSAAWQYVAGSTSPVALTRTEPGTDNRETRSLMDQLAIALGRPTVAEARGR
jgi:hypothetical protein